MSSARTPVRDLARWLVPALVTACYAPTPSTGTPCASACPMGQVCVDGVCRDRDDAPDAPDAPLVLDEDGDHIADADDNCPHAANEDQSDDLEGDACDACPHLAAAEADADTDGDKVGDGCDPEPTIPRQSFVVFDSFATPRAGWTFLNAQQSAGQLHVLDGRATLTAPTGELRIIVGGTIDALPGTSFHQVLVMFGANAAGANFHYAELYDDSLGASVNATKAAAGTYTVLAKHALTGALPTNAWSLVIDESVTAQRIDVAGSIAGVPFTAVSGDTRPTPKLASGGEIHLATNHADVRFAYIAVIRTQP